MFKRRPINALVRLVSRLVSLAQGETKKDTRKLNRNNKIELNCRENPCPNS